MYNQLLAVNLLCAAFHDLSAAAIGVTVAYRMTEYKYT